MKEVTDTIDPASRWIEKPLGEIVDSIRPGFPCGDHNRKGIGVPHLRPMNISPKGEIDMSDVKFVDEEFEPLKEGDVLFNNTNSPVWVGKTAYINRDQKWAYSNHMTRLRGFDDGIDPKWIAYWLSALQTFGYFQLHCRNHVNQASIGVSFLEDLSVPLPSLEEQRDIVAKIEELFSNLDAGVDGLQTAQKQLERYRLSVLQAAVEGRLTAQWRQENPDVEPAEELLERILEERREQWEEHYRWSRYDSKGKEPPKGWKSRYKEREAAKLPDTALQLPDTWTWISADKIGRVETGSTPKTSVEEYYGGEHPFYRPGDLEAGINTRTAERTLTEKGLAEARPLPERSTLITCIGATIGKTGLIHTRGASNQQINAIIPAPSVNNEYLFYVAESPFFQTLIKTRASATTMPILNKGRTQKLPIPLPPLAEQKQIVAEIERLLSVAEDAVQTVENENTRAARLRQSILKQAFSGTLVPHDDAPAPPASDGTVTAQGQMEMGL